jgi:purine-binding chemotaxis protein CheW
LADRTITLGLFVDRVVEVASVSAAEVNAAPDVGIAWRSEYIAGVVRRDDGFLVLIDMARVFSSDDVAQIAAPSRPEAA